MAVSSSGTATRLPLQVVLYFNGWYLALLYVGELCLFVYKGVERSYSAGTFVAEVVLLLFLAVLDTIRIFLGAKGNLTERKLPLLLSLVLVLPVVCGYLYFTVWQTHMLRLEVIMLAMAYTGLALEVILGLITLCIFQRNDSLRIR